MDIAELKKDPKVDQVLPEIEEQASNVKMSENSINEGTKGDENESNNVTIEDSKDLKEDNDLDRKNCSKNNSPVSKTSEVSTSSEQTKIKRAKSKAKINGDNGISMEKSEESSEEDSSKRQKMSETQSDSEVAECSGSKHDFSFRKLKSTVKKRYYRNKNNAEEEEESGETSGTHKSEYNEDKQESDSYADDNMSLDPENVEENEQPSRERSCDSLEQNNGLKLVARGADDSNEWTTASEEEVDIPILALQKEKPKPNWFVIQELFKRQMGNNPQFANRFYGSLQAVERLVLVRNLIEHEGCVNSLNFNQKGNLLASASDDLTVNIWDWAIGKKLYSFETGHKSNVFQAKWMPLDMQNLMVTGARDGQVRLFNLTKGKSDKIASHQGAIYKLAIHKETPHVILSCGADGKILSIDIRERKPDKLTVIKEGMMEVLLYSIDCNPLNVNEFCVGGRNQTVRVYDRRKMSTVLHKLCPSHLVEKKHAHVTSAVYNYNGTEVLASYNDEDIYLFDTMSAKMKESSMYPQSTQGFVHKYQGHRNDATIKGVTFFGPKSEYVVSGSDCGNIFIWDKETEAIVQWKPGDMRGVVNSIEPHPFIPVLATCGLDYDVKIWMPCCEEPLALMGLDNCVLSNLKSRAEEADKPDALDGNMLWIFLRRIHENMSLRHSNRAFRRTRNVERELGDDELNESSNDYNSSNNSDSFSDDENEGRLQCSPS